MSADATEARAAQGRRDAEKRWAPYRAARIAAGLPPTRESETRRTPRFIDDPEVEEFWLAEVERLHVTESRDRTSLRLAAKRLADAAAAKAGEYDDESPSSAPEGDDEVVEAYWRGEVARWRRHAARDRTMAEKHEQFADDAERELGAILARRKKAR